MGVWLKRLAMVAGAALFGAALAYTAVCGRPGTGPAPGGEPARSTAGLAQGGAGDGTLRIGWTAWGDADLMTRLAERLVERHFDLKVERTMADIGIQYQGVAGGDLDLMMMAWLPVTHRNYWDKVSDRVIDLGPLYSGWLGWAVPSYVPEAQVASIADLRRPEVRKRLEGRIQGIDPGSGLMQASQRALDTYDLDYRLVSASSAAMTAALDRAVRNQRWIVVTAWNPHWVFAEYDLRTLADPEGVLGGNELVHALARPGFLDDFSPELAAFFSRMHLPRSHLATMLAHANRTSYATAVERYIDEHPDRIRYWLTGEVAPPSQEKRAPTN
jgi:glycine betaine/proline transport system substrate-binding protein